VTFTTNDERIAKQRIFETIAYDPAPKQPASDLSLLVDNLPLPFSTCLCSAALLATIYSQFKEKQPMPA